MSKDRTQREYDKFVEDNGGNTAIRTFISDGNNDLAIWGSGGITVVNEMHYRVKNSKEFLTSHLFTNISSVAYVLIKVASTHSSHGIFSISTSGKCYAKLYEHPTITNEGTQLNPICLNRETTATPTTTLYHTPTVSSNGTLIEQAVIGTAGKFTSTGGVDTGAFWLLKPNEEYLIEITNADTTNIDVSLEYMWHEHEAA